MYRFAGLTALAPLVVGHSMGRVNFVDITDDSVSTWQVTTMTRERQILVAVDNAVTP